MQLPSEQLEKHFLQKPLKKCKQADAILLGAVGDPAFDGVQGERPEIGLLQIRKALGLFANIRPINLFPQIMQDSPLKPERLKGVDFVVYRELTGGIYFGEKGRTETGAYDHCTYDTKEIERIGKLAFEAAMQRNMHLTVVDKANVLETSRLWRETIDQLASKYPEVTVDYMYVDNAAMQLILNPAQFDVIVTENMFGDILTDEASVITGSIGMLPSASIGEQHALFEPIHGSYPQAAGLGIANPMATILSCAMLLEHLDLIAEAKLVRKAVSHALDQGFVTPDLNPNQHYDTAFVGEMIAEYILEEKIDFKAENVYLSRNAII